MPGGGAGGREGCSRGGPVQGHRAWARSSRPGEELGGGGQAHPHQGGELTVVTVICMAGCGPHTVFHRQCASQACTVIMKSQESSYRCLGSWLLMNCGKPWPPWTSPGSAHQGWSGRIPWFGAWALRSLPPPLFRLPHTCVPLPPRLVSQTFGFAAWK